MNIVIRKVGKGWDLSRLRLFVQRLTAGEDRAVVACGYEAHYAVYQHENLQYQHLPGREAKFLEKTIRNRRVEIGDVVAKEIKRTVSMAAGLEAAAHYILDQSNKIVPLDTGFLEDSTFVRRER